MEIQPKPKGGADAGTTVATVINNMYPDVFAGFLPPDMIQLTMRNLPSGRDMLGHERAKRCKELAWFHGLSLGGTELKVFD